MITVLVLMAFMLAIGITVAAVGQDEIVLSGVFQDGEQAFAIADACVEEGIERFKVNGAYTGSTFALDGGTCIITVTDLGGNRRLVRGQGNYANAIRIIDADVTLKFNLAGNAKKVTINSWLEAD
jgi:hypothetical protein